MRPRIHRLVLNPPSTRSTRVQSALAKVCPSSTPTPPASTSASKPASARRRPRSPPPKIARVVYHLCKYGVEYEQVSAQEDEQQFREREIRHLQRKAARLGF